MLKNAPIPPPTALAVVLLFFQGDIRKAFGSFGESLGEGFGNIDISLPEINLPDITFPEITFPEITFPDFPNPFEGFNLFDLFNGNGDGAPIITDTNVPPDLMCECGTEISQDASGLVTSKCIPCAMKEPEIFGPIGPLDPNRPTSIAQIIPQMIKSISGTVQTAIPDQTFQGGGSFLYWGVSNRNSTREIIFRIYY